MDIGVTVPQLEIGSDPVPICEFAKAADELGFEHLLASDHVLGANADRDGGWSGPYDHTDQFHEPLTLFGYLAGATGRITLATGILVLPQRQTALVAKQAAEVDRLSGGRLRLGVAVGWNPIEFVGLGQSFEERGRRIEEQIQVCRQLWTENPTTFDGTFHEIPDAGINPLPVQQPIPIWMGGTAEVVLRRVARQADGWIPQRQPGDGLQEQLDTIYEHAEAIGRDPGEIGLNGRVGFDGDEEAVVEGVAAWEDVGAEYVSIHTGGQGFDPAEHVTAIETVASALERAGFSLADAEG